MAKSMHLVKKTKTRRALELLGLLVALGGAVAVGFAGAGEMIDVLETVLHVSTEISTEIGLGLGVCSILTNGFIFLHALHELEEEHKEVVRQAKIEEEELGLTKWHKRWNAFKRGGKHFVASSLASTNAVIETFAILGMIESVLNFVPGLGSVIVRPLAYSIAIFLWPMQYVFAHHEIKSILGIEPKNTIPFVEKPLWKQRLIKSMDYLGVFSACVFGLVIGLAGGVGLGMKVGILVGGPPGAILGACLGVFIGLPTIFATAISAYTTVKEISGQAPHGGINTLISCLKRMNKLRKGTEMLNGLGEGSGIFMTISNSHISQALFKIPAIGSALTGGLLACMAVTLMTKGFFKRFLKLTGPRKTEPRKLKRGGSVPVMKLEFPEKAVHQATKIKRVSSENQMDLLASGKLHSAPLLSGLAPKGLEKKAKRIGTTKYPLKRSMSLNLDGEGVHRTHSYPELSKAVGFLRELDAGKHPGLVRRTRSMENLEDLRKEDFSSRPPLASCGLK